MGKKFIKSLAVFFLLSVCLTLYITNQNYSQTKYKYIGVEKCAKLCHRGEKKGSQLEIWEETTHSKSFVTLATPYAKKILKSLGDEGEPQKSEKCLQCHSTGYGLDKSNFDKTFKIEEGVTCEACHGPGSVYKSLSIMKDREKFLANGGIVPTEKECLKCHNNKAHDVYEFNFDERSKKIAHLIPKK